MKSKKENHSRCHEVSEHDKAYHKYDGSSDDNRLKGIPLDHRKPFVKQKGVRVRKRLEVGGGSCCHSADWIHGRHLNDTWHMGRVRG